MVKVWLFNLPENSIDDVISVNELSSGLNRSAFGSEDDRIIVQNKAITAVVEPEFPELIVKEDWQTVIVDSGDSLSTLFNKVGLTPQDVYRIVKATRDKNVFTELRAGQELGFIINQRRIEKIRHVKTPLLTDLVVRNEDGSYIFEKLTRDPEVKQVLTNGSIYNSLFVDGQKAGLSQKKLMELADIFAWDIDFALDIRAGDGFTVLHEKTFLDDVEFGEGQILAAQFRNKDRVLNAVLHNDGNYYDENGYSMRKAFLRSPVDFFRISSKFNPQRLHPILNIVRPHRGVDYAAPKGTPIKASGDGKVIWRGTKGGYGRTVIIQHAGVYTTLYAHLSKYNSKVVKGARVKQGQVIGYIGMSGTATGPNLHYEFRVNGEHENPLKVNFPNSKPLKEQELKSFKLNANMAVGKIESYNG